MKIFALVVFTLHVIAELVFGANAFLSGGFSSQTAEDLADQPANIAGSARFLGAALMSLGLLGAIVVFGPGVGSAMGRAVAGLLMFFHGIGVVGVLLTAQQYAGYMTQGAAPLIVHLVLALGFLIVFARHRSMQNG